MPVDRLQIDRRLREGQFTPIRYVNEPHLLTDRIDDRHVKIAPVPDTERYASEPGRSLLRMKAHAEIRILILQSIGQERLITELRTTR